MTKTLKQVLIDYRKCKTQEEQEEVLLTLYGQQIVEVLDDKNRDKVNDRIYKLRFNIDSIQKAYNHIKKKFYRIPENDIQSYINEQIQYIFDKGNVDFNKEDKQIESWFFKTLTGRVQNQIKREYEKTKLDVSEQIVNKSHEETGTRYDDVAIQKFEDGEITYTFDEFIELIGGYKKILSNKQFDIFTYINNGMTQEEIAEKLNCKQQNVQKHLSSAIKRISNKYIEYRTLYIQTHSHNTTETIRNYIHTYNDILQFDIHNNFDYFGFTYKFLKDQYKNYNTYDNNATTVFDVLFERLKAHESDIFNKLEQSFNNPKITFTGRNKDRIIRITNKIFKQYIEEINAATVSISGDVINKLKKRNSDYKNYDKFLDIIS